MVALAITVSEQRHCSIILYNILVSRFKDVYFLTNKDNGTGISRNGERGWTTCYYSAEEREDTYTVYCDSNRTPLTREFSVAVGNDGGGVGLREVEIYGNGKNKKTEVNILSCV